jgi:hypothetical protein
MSDMLQLVVDICDTQAMITVTSHIESSNLDDKLKHVGHLERNVNAGSLYIPLQTERDNSMGRGYKHLAPPEQGNLNN